MKNQTKIGVVGLWHLGCVIAASWSKLANNVIGFDHDTSRVNKLKTGEPPLFEPGLKECIAEQMAGRKLAFTSNIGDLSQCEFIFLSYDTPVWDDDSADTTILKKSVEELGSIMKNGAVLIVSSQTPARYCSELRKALRAANSSLDIAYSPENLRLGEALECYMNPGRIILGTAEAATESKCRILFSQIKAEILSMNLESAEMVKHGINSFLANSIVFANHLSDLCETSGAVIDDVVKGMKTDPRIGAKAYLAPGIGFSGGTLGRDLRVLESLNDAGKGFARIFGIIHQLNAERKKAIVGRVQKILGGVGGKKAAVLGVTYKPGTSTLRRSLPLEIIDLLMAEGMSVRVFDPKADYSELSSAPKFTVCHSAAEALQGVEIAILLTEWKEFRNIDWKEVKRHMSQHIIFDTKNFLDRKAVEGSGLTYHSVGR